MMAPSRQEQIAAVAALLRELTLPATLLSLLIAHADAVGRDSDRLGLVAREDADVVLARHTADSLLFAIARAPAPGERWADVGSGAGFPGLVLAACYPAAEFVLVEPQRRRAGFLEVQRDVLGLENVIVEPRRAEALAPSYDVVVARALAEPVLALEAMDRLAGSGGTALLAVGDGASVPLGVTDLRLARPGVDSPGRLFMIARSRGGA